MRLYLRLSGGLRAILSHLSEEVTIQMEAPATLEEILIRAGINPMLAVTVYVDGELKDKRQVIERDARIDVLGPMAGG